jgi:hypothetical protein
VVSQSRVSGDAYPRSRTTTDGGIGVSDGTVDPTPSGVLWDVRGRPNEVTLRVRAGQDVSVHSVQDWVDRNGAEIMWLLNAGGLNVNDDLATTKSVFGPDGFRADIYGFTKQLQVAQFCHAGPPGNKAAFDQATAEVFQQSRGPSTGDWGTVFGATTITVTDNPVPGTVPPGETFHVRQLTQASNTTLVTVAPAAGSNGWAVAPGQKIRAFTSVRAATTGRTFTAAIQFYDSSNNYLSSSDLTGTAVASSTTAWTKVTVGGTVPASAAKAQFKLLATSVPVGESHYESGFGVWLDTRTSGSADPNPSSVWSPPLVPWPGAGTFTGSRTGDWYRRTDTPGTAGTILYVLDGAADTVYAPSAVGAPGSTAQPRWKSVL